MSNVLKKSYILSTSYDLLGKLLRVFKNFFIV